MVGTVGHRPPGRSPSARQSSDSAPSRWPGSRIEGEGNAAPTALRMADRHTHRSISSCRRTPAGASRTLSITGAKTGPEVNAVPGRVPGGSASFDVAEGLLAGPGVASEQAADGRRHRERPRLLYPSHSHTQVLRLDHHEHAPWLQGL